MLTEKLNANCAEAILLGALNNVQNLYMRHSYNRVTLGYQRIESLFSHEIYHQLRLYQDPRNQLPHCCDRDQLKDIVYHMALPKGIYQVENCPCVENINLKRIIPDVVFHGGQNNMKNQLLIGEIKMKGANFNLIVKDLQKLIYYKISKLKFENAVLIYSGDKSDLEEKLTLGLSTQMLNCLISNKIVVALSTKATTNQRKIWKIFKFEN
jgi:hypothetical protein